MTAVDAEQSAVILGALPAAGFGCEALGEGTVCRIEQRGVTLDDEEYTRGETHYIGDAGLVTTTTEAAREIELSTKQQTTAVEQVNLAIANVTQAARETEASTTQTLDTASLLTATSTDLMKLVQARQAA